MPGMVVQRRGVATRVGEIVVVKHTQLEVAAVLGIGADVVAGTAAEVAVELAQASHEAGTGGADAAEQRRLPVMQSPATQRQQSAGRVIPAVEARRHTQLPGVAA